MEFDEVERLLNADNAALVLAFLGVVFVDENVRSIAAVELAAAQVPPARFRRGAL